MFRPAFHFLLIAFKAKHWHRRFFVKAEIGVVLYFLSQLTIADHLGTATGDVLLRVSGNVALHEQSRQYLFDLAMLEALDQTSVLTDNPWTVGPTKYSGIRISLLLELVGAKSSDFVAHASDHYSFTVANVDFDKYPVIIAYKKNDKPMSVRNLGPLWIIFPFDDYPELLTEKNKAASVWQLDRIVVN